MIEGARSLQARLYAVALLATLSALACALAVIVSLHAWSSHRQDLRELERQAALLGRMTTPALVFDDPALARENLALFESDPRIRAAALYGADHRAFATYRAQQQPGTLPARPGEPGGRLAGGQLEVYLPIPSRTGGPDLGTVYLQAQSGVASALLRGGLAALAAALLAMALAWLLVRRMLGRVTDPIAAMSAVARRVVAERDYSRRVAKVHDDEVGGLVDAFNAMLEEVESRTEQLRVSLDSLQREAAERERAQVEVQYLNERLEERVAARTLDLERSNRALDAARAAAEQANQAKSSFLATMSHEIRTPMNGVIGMIDVLHQSSLRDDQVEMVDLIRESAMSLLAIIDDILDFSKIEANRMEVEAAPIDIGQVVEGACAMLAHVAMRKGVELCMFVDPRIPSPVLGDSLRLRQVVVNLVGNAIKFSADLDRPGRVHVRADLVSEPGGGEARVAISVQDNGIGMDEQTRSRLFTAFSQSDSSTTRRYGGSGLGLAISHRLVEMMGGRIGATSEPGRGSTFAIRLAFQVPPGAVDWDAPPALPPIGHLPCVLVGRSGLVQDMQAYLDASGCRTTVVDDVPAAIDHLAGQAALRPVIVVDAHGMAPGLGLDVARLLDMSRGVIAVRHHVRRHWARPDPRYREIDCAMLTRRNLACSIAALASGEPAAEPETVHPRRAQPEPQSREDALRQGRLVLVAEDNEFNQQVILRQLRLLGCAADIAPNGGEALARWRAIPYGLVLTDLHMPGMDGYDLAARIREDHSPRGRVPILALTANALKGEAERCRAVGMDGYLTKPILLEELATELARWLPPVQPSAPDALPGGDLPPVLAGVLESFVGDDPHAVRAFLARFDAMCADLAVQIAAACASGELDAVRIHAHSLKGAARMAGATVIAAHCAEAEALARDGDAHGLGQAIPALQASVARLHAYLDERGDTGDASPPG